MRIALFAILVACSTPTRGNQGTDASTSHADGPPAQRDAPVSLDAPVAVTLTQTTTLDITPGRSIGCTVSNTKVTRATSYFRVFALPDSQITGGFHVTDVAFGVEQAAAGAGATTQPATLKVGTYSGSAGGNQIAESLITTLQTVPIQIANTTNTMIRTPISADIPPGGTLVVELDVPDGSATNTILQLGMNGGGESQPGYLLGSGCGITPPSSIKLITGMLSLPESDLVMTVTGTH